MSDDVRDSVITTVYVAFAVSMLVGLVLGHVAWRVFLTWARRNRPDITPEQFADVARAFLTPWRRR